MGECSCGRSLYQGPRCRRCYEADLRRRQTKAIRDEMVLQLVDTVANAEETARRYDELHRQIAGLREERDALAQRIDVLERRQRSTGNLSALVVGLCRHLEIEPRELVDGTTDGL